MQKKIIALAVAGLASTAAFAQTNVTIYGVADVTFDVASATGAANGSSANRGSFTRVSSNSSLIGFKGEEALGNGLKAVFQFEQGVNVDQGAASLTNRDTFVGLSGGFGTVQAGNLTGPTRALGSMIDLNAGATGPGANSSLIGKVAGGSGSGTFDTRFANTIAYVSPSFSGLTAIAAYVSGENKSLDGVNAAGKINTYGYDLGAIYSNGPILAGLTFGKVDNQKDGAAAGSNLNQLQILRLAGGYTFNGGHKVNALYEQNKAKYNGVAGGDVKRNIWGLGGKFMVSSVGGLIAQYYQAQNASGSLVTNGSNTGARLYEIGYEHALSKRTMLKAAYSRIDNKDNANYDFNVGAVGGGFGNGANPQVISAGLRHTF